MSGSSDLYDMSGNVLAWEDARGSSSDAVRLDSIS
jgi:hypothetical protein